MKKNCLLLTATILLFTAASAQKTFEGKIVFETKYEGRGAANMSALAPSGSTYFFSGNDLRIETHGGVTGDIAGYILVKGDEKKSYLVKDKEKTAYKNKPEVNDTVAQKAVPSFFKEDEEVTIQGYNCQKYKVVTQVEGKEVVVFMWITSEIQAKANTGGMGLIPIGVPGVPLKKITTAQFGDVNVTSTETAILVDPTLPNKALFQIPAGYAVKDFDQQAVLGRKRN